VNKELLFFDSPGTCPSSNNDGCNDDDDDDDQAALQLHDERYYFNGHVLDLIGHLMSLPNHRAKHFSKSTAFTYQHFVRSRPNGYVGDITYVNVLSFERLLT